MKQGIHPEFKVAKVTCSCGNSFETRSVAGEIHVELCNECHPFYTGKQKLVDTGGRVERFQKKYGNRNPAQRPAPEAQQSDAQQPEAQQPEAQQPEAQQPEAQQSDAQQPDSGATEESSPAADAAAE